MSGNTNSARRIFDAVLNFHFYKNIILGSFCLGDFMPFIWRNKLGSMGRKKNCTLAGTRYSFVTPNYLIMHANEWASHTNYKV